MGGMNGTLNAGEASELRGTLKENQELSGTLKENQELNGTLKEQQELRGTLKEQQELNGNLKEKQNLNGTLKEKQNLHGVVASLGEDGGYYIPAVEQVDENTMQLSFAASKENMMPVAPQNVTLPAGYTPQKGKDYQDGKDGASVTVQSVEQSTADGGSNVVTFSDGTKLIVKNGSKGNPGYTPVKGVDYDDGKDGDDGYTPVKGVDYDDGKDGYTPVKGTDYFTAEEIDAVATQAAGKVTAESIGARPDTWMPTTEDVGARSDTWLPTIVEIGAAPLAHAEDIFSNPHCVTAEQVGARPDTWMPTAEEVGARPSTWMPTIAEIGAASADHKHIEKIWENANKGGDFPAQTVPLDLSGYSHIIVTSSVGNYPDTGLASSGLIDNVVNAVGYLSTFATDFWMHTRHFAIRSNGIEFGSGYMKDTSNGTVYADWGIRSIPTAIYGVRGG